MIVRGFWPKVNARAVNVDNLPILHKWLDHKEVVPDWSRLHGQAK